MKVYQLRNVVTGIRKNGHIVGLSGCHNQKLSTSYTTMVLDKREMDGLYLGNNSRVVSHQTEVLS